MYRKNIIVYVMVLTGVLLLLLPALYNGYPLVNSDDGTYITSGFKLEQPGDRPIVYGVFLRVFSLNGYSFWAAVAFQAAVLSWLIVMVLKSVGNNKYLVRNSIITFIILALTSASWTVSEIIPDIWTAIALLCLSLIISGKQKGVITVVLYLIYICAVATHMSNIMIFTILLILLLFLKKVFLRDIPARQTNIRLMLLLCATWVTYAAMSFSYNKSRHVFMMGSLVEKGILKEYLNENCAEKKYGLCQYLGALPTDPNAFLWDFNNSPLYKQGGWDATKEEYSDIIGDVLTNRKYLGMFMQQSVAFSWKQLFECHLAEGNYPFPEGTQLYSVIKDYAPRDTAVYKNAWQHETNIVERLNILNNISYVLVIAGLIILAYAFLSRRNNSLVNLFIFLFLAGYAINIWNCATFAQVNARYGSRMIWMIPLAALLFLLQDKATGASRKT